MLDELLLFVGYFALENERNQAMLNWQKAAQGQSLGVLQILCTKIPFGYFSNIAKMHVLFPTLIIACYSNESSRAVLEREISMELLVEYIDQQTDCAGGGDLDDSRCEFTNRFPTRLWRDARTFFETEEECNEHSLQSK